MIKKVKIFLKDPSIILLYFRLIPLYFSKRFKKGYFLIDGKRFIFSDPLSFVFMFFDIFIEKSYKFKSKNENPTIIDCGSNIGLSVLYFKKIYPDSIIKAFEPDKEIFKILEENCAKFKMKNVTLFNKGVWSEDGSYNFLSDGCDGGRILGENVSEKKNLVEMVSLKKILENEKHVDLLKIDIEGAELEVLKSCRDNLSNVELLFLEYHSRVDKKQELSEILLILENTGFRYYIADALSSKNAFVDKANNNGFDLQLNIYAFR